MAVIVMCSGLSARRMDDARILIDRHRAVPMRVIVMLDRIAARISRMRTEDSDQAGEYRADQRQKDDCLDH